MAVNVGLIIVSVFIFFGVLGGITWFAVSRGKYRFLFRVWSKDLRSSYIVKAKITVDKENKNNRLFTFKNNPSKLIMRDPVHHEKSRPERWVLADESGEYQYLSPINNVFTSKDVVEEDGVTVKKVKVIDDVLYMKTRMHPVDKQLALEGMRNSQKRYETADKVGLATMLSLIGLTAVLVIGMIYGISVITKNANAVGDNSRILKEMSASHDSASLKIIEAMKEVTNNLAYIYGQINSNVTVIRPIGGVQP